MKKPQRAAAPSQPPRRSKAPLSQFYVAPENARFDKPAIDVPELAANIAACGLLQEPVAYEDSEGRFGIVAGARRFNALNHNAAAGVAMPGIDLDAIDFTLIDQADANTATVAENEQRRDLTIVEQAVAWHRMTKNGREIAEISKAFGRSEKFIKQRVQLASLHEPILQALDAGEIKLDVAQLYAGAQMHRQEKIWKQFGKKSSAWKVKEELKRNTVHAGDATARFVGLAAYEEAGGKVERDLFIPEDMWRLLDPKLLDTLAKQKLADAAAKLKGEGFKFIDAAVEMESSKYADGNAGKPRKAEPGETARLKEIAARDKAIDAEQSKLRKRRWDDTDLDDDAFNAAFDTLDAEQDRLRAEANRIKAGQIEFDDKAKARTGIAVTVDADGALLITRGVVKRAAGSPNSRNRNEQSISQKRAAKSGKAADKKAAPAAPMTNAAHERCFAVASAAVGRAIASNPDLAVTAMAAFFARELFAVAGGQAIALDNTETDWARRRELDAPKLATDKGWEEQSKAWAEKLGKDETQFEAIIAAWPQAQRHALFAFGVGSFIHVREFNAAHTVRKDDARHKLAALGALALADPVIHFTPDAEFLSGLSQPAIDAALDEIGADAAGCKTKSAKVALLADKSKAAPWTPPLIRTLCGIDVKPVPKAKPKKAAKKAAAPKKAKKLAKPPAKKIAVKKSKHNGSAEARP